MAAAVFLFALRAITVSAVGPYLIPCPGQVQSDADEVQTLIEQGPTSIGPTTCACKVTDDYEVAPGFFRLNASSPPVECNAGSYCPGNMTEPSFCCPGYVCTRDTLSMSPCGEGYFCPPQSIQKQECGALTVCEPRTDKQDKWGTILFIVVFGLAVWFLWYLYNMGNHKKDDFYLSMIDEVSRAEKEAKKKAQYEEMQEMKSAQWSAASNSEFKSKSDPKKAESVVPPAMRMIVEEESNIGADEKKKESTSEAHKEEESKSDDKPPVDSMKSRIEEKETPATVSDETLRDKELHFTIRFEDLQYTLPDGFTIMQGVTGEFKKGRLCAVMGPSGAGKTTLFNLITGKAKRTGGRVLLNGEVSELSKYKRLVGFVPQEDIMLRSATVTDVLNFSARRRLPNSHSSKDINHLVARYIHKLGIGHVATTVIGDARKRGISGGQRKRVNVGMELVANPSVLFLDEPTTGLDASTAYDLCSTLRNLCRDEQLTGAAVIHSPSQSAFEEFDDLCLLGRGGRLIYIGPREEALPYFELLGFEKPPNQNPADFFLEVAMGRTESSKLVNFHWSGLFALWEDHCRAVEADKLGGAEYVKQMEQAIKKTNDNTLKRQESMRESQASSAGDEKPGACSKFCAKLGDFFKRFFYVITVELYRYWFSADNGVCVELFTWLKSIACWFNPGYSNPIRQLPNGFYIFWLCLQRAVKQTYGDFGAFLGEMALPIAVGLLSSATANGLVFIGRIEPEVCDTLSPAQQIGQCEQPVRDGYQSVAMFLLIATSFSGITMGSSTFGAERTVFYRHASTGMDAIPYIAAKVLADIPKAIIAAVLTSVLFFVQFYPVGNVGNFYALMMVFYLCSFAQGYFLSIIIAYDYIPLCGVVWTLFWAIAFGGTTTRVSQRDSMPPFLQWIFSMSVFRWGIEAFYINEIKFYADYLDVEDRLNYYGYDLDNFATDIGAILLINLFYVGLTLVSMKLVGRRKMK
eukprot:CAMPEP_0167789252 /NCGR_PEP_ID=MMETSP0111_2-20121227/10568_1 /TAXON_ID=91324 /ORGANISM="Lotharella globosa, Strain CCCM811" /LENGTH=973 /DNA_ID=CAMNT_0007681371 /DNA_START=21 /DNA_END=2942 /DNA_ORIENTATION=+